MVSCLFCLLVLSLGEPFAFPFSLDLISQPRPFPFVEQNQEFSWVARCTPRVRLASSFYGDFDEDDDDDDDEDDDEYDDVDDSAVEDFRSKMSSLFGESSPITATDTSTDEDEQSSSVSAVDELISFARSKDTEKLQETEWARVKESVRPGTILAAHPSKFCSDFGAFTTTPSPALLAKFGLTLPPPADLGPDRRADLLPVLVVVGGNGKRNTQAVLLNRRTGYLLGDLEQPRERRVTGGDSSSSPAAPLLEKFCIQPLWFGGVDNVISSEYDGSGGVEDSGGGGGGGLDMLHLCPTVVGSTELPAGDKGLYWGGDPAQAQDAMSDASLERVFTGFDFKFFVQSTLWGPNELEQEIQDGTWICATVSNAVLFKSRDRMGTRRAKPLWTEIMELLGGEYQQIRDRLYEKK